MGGVANLDGEGEQAFRSHCGWRWVEKLLDQGMWLRGLAGIPAVDEALCGQIALLAGGLPVV
jgi:hypothetical protein